MSIVFGLDTSVWSKRGAITVAEWESLRKYERQQVAVVGSWHGLSVNWHAGQDLKNAEAAGLIPATYIVLSSSYPTAFHLQCGKDACGAMWPKLRFVALDIELHMVDPVNDIREAIAWLEAEGQRVCIYTARWAWDAYAGSTTALADVPLWYANYNGRDELGAPNFGGWAKAIGHQYAGTTALMGLSVDLNVFDEEFLKEETMPTPEERIEDLEWEIKNIRIGMSWINAARAYHEADRALHVDSERLQQMDDRYADLERRLGVRPQ